MQFGDEARHLFLEGFAVVCDFLGTDVAAGREDVAVRGDLGGGGGFAEAGDVGILTQRRRGFEIPFSLCVSASLREIFPSPRMVGVHDLREVGVGQFAVDAVDEGAEFAGVDEEGVFAAVAEAALDIGYGRRTEIFRSVRSVCNWLQPPQPGVSNRCELKEVLAPVAAELTHLR